MDDPTTPTLEETTVSVADAIAHLNEYRRMTEQRDAYRLRTRLLVAAGVNLAEHLQGCASKARDAGAITLALEIEEAVMALQMFATIETEE